MHTNIIKKKRKNRIAKVVASAENNHKSSWVLSEN